MGYCYTRDAGLFALADGMGGHPEGEVASQLALQTLAALFQREAKPQLADPLRFLHEAIIAGHHQLLRYATERALIDTPRTTIVACVLQGNAAYWAHCGDSRLYLVRGGKLIARTRDHSYTELQETLSQVVPIGDTHQPQRAVHLPGQPGQAGGRHRRPAAGARRATACCCAATACGARSATRVITEQLARSGRREAVPELVEQALRNAGDEERQRHRAVRRVGSRPRTATASGVSTRDAGRRGLRVDDPGQPGRRRAARRTRRRRDRALDPRDQRSHPALVRKRRSSSERCAAPPRRTSLQRTPRAARRRSATARRQLRPVRIDRGYTRHAEGSVLVAFGAHPGAVHRVGRGKGAAAQARQRRGLGHRRVRHAAARHAHPQRPRGRARQAERPHAGDPAPDRPLAAQRVRPAALGERTIHLDCDVLQADGGTRTAAITGAFVAAHDAVSWLLRAGPHRAHPDPRLRRRGVGRRRCSGTPLLDLEYVEDSALRHRHERRDDRQRRFRRSAGHRRRRAVHARARWTRCWRWPSKGIARAGARCSERRSALR